MHGSAFRPAGSRPILSPRASGFNARLALGVNLLLCEQGFSLERVMDLFCGKYGNDSRFVALRSLLYFEDVEAEPDPVYCNGWTWPWVREQLIRLIHASPSVLV